MKHSKKRGWGLLGSWLKKLKAGKWWVLLVTAVGLPVAVMLVFSPLRFWPKGAESDPEVFFTPSLLEMPPDTAVKVMVDAKAHKVGFVRLTIDFDPNLVNLTDEVVVSNTFRTVMTKTSKTEANQTGRVILMMGTGIEPGDVLLSGIGEVASLPLTAITPNLNTITSLSLIVSDSQIVNDVPESLNIISQPLSITLNPSQIPAITPTPTPSPTPTPDIITPTPTPTPDITPDPTATPDPTTDPTPSPTPSPTPTPTPDSGGDYAAPPLPACNQDCNPNVAIDVCRQSFLNCDPIIRKCRKLSCMKADNCVCPQATPTPKLKNITKLKATPVPKASSKPTNRPKPSPTLPSVNLSQLDMVPGKVKVEGWWLLARSIESGYMIDVSGTYTTKSTRVRMTILGLPVSINGDETDCVSAINQQTKEYSYRCGYEASLNPGVYWPKVMINDGWGGVAAKKMLLMVLPKWMGW